LQELWALLNFILPGTLWYGCVGTHPTDCSGTLASDVFSSR
jgi:SNF2 family DNA or RNA helicase